MHLVNRRSFLRKAMVTALVAVMLCSVATAYAAPGLQGKPGNPVEVVNLAAGLSYAWSDPPNPSYPDTGGELTDGQYGGSDFGHPAWQGHSRNPQKIERTVTFDLGSRKSISQIKAHFIQDISVGIYFPCHVKFEVSHNGVVWGELAQKDSKTPLWQTGEEGLTQFFTWDGAVDGFPKGNPHADKVYAQYVRVTIPQDVWIFIDEVEIWGVDGKADGAHVLPPSPDKPNPDRGYLQPGEATGGIHDLVLLYNGWYEGGLGDWEKDDIIPYISYVDEKGYPTDWFYDGVLFLALRTPGGRDMHHYVDPSNLEDWQWFLDKTFAPEGDMDQLNQASAEVGSKLGEADHKVKVVISIPYPAHTQSEFGDLDGDGVTESFNHLDIGLEQALENKTAALDWYVDEVMERWQAGNYANLELSGLYWIREDQDLSSPNYVELVQHASQLVKAQDLQFFWIPYFQAPRFYNWELFGMDAAALQPNYFFGNSSETTRIGDAANFAQKYGLGMEMEFDERMLTDPEKRKQYIEYLNGGVTFGYMNNVFKGHYQGNNSLLRAAQSADPDQRILYDWMYQFVKGTYELQPVE